MRKIVVLTVLLSIFGMQPGPLQAQVSLPEKYRPLAFGSIKPAGWLKIQMQKDMDGFVGNLDKLVPDLMHDSIYGADRLHKNSKNKELGNIKTDNAEGSEEYKWWNSETQSNWRDGYIRNALLLDDQKAIENVNTYIRQILSTQDADGYLGIYDKELRYKFNSENGELWSKTTIYRGLLAYCEYYHDKKVWAALLRAVDNVMTNYPMNHSHPFYAGKEFSGGVGHGLTFTDILDRLYQLTANRKYWDYAHFLYQDFSENPASEKDAQLTNILNPNYKLNSHGVHTYEHLRPLLVAAYSAGTPELQKALAIYLQRINSCTTATGGAIGDEWIGGRTADAANTGYEYCSLTELMNSYCLLLQKSGQLEYAEKIENIFYNAAQGARNPDHSCIAYLKTDNSYEMMGPKNADAAAEPGQTRYKYSPAHQDVAVCCAPNAGRISPYFLQSSWMIEGDSILVAALLCPNTLQTIIHDNPVKIEELTEYPFGNSFVFRIHCKENIAIKIKIRKPEWATSINASEAYLLQEGFIIINRTFKDNDQFSLEFPAIISLKEDQNHEKYFSYGALIYARQIPANEIKGRIYAPGFEDLKYQALDSKHYEYVQDNQAIYKDGEIQLLLRNTSTQKPEKIKLVPLAKTILRQASFK